MVRMGRGAVSRWIILSALACLCIGPLSTSLVHAERATILLVRGTQVPPETHTELAGALADSLAEHDIAIVSGFALAKASLGRGEMRPTEKRQLDRAQTLLDEGWQSYLEVRASFAAARLAEARTVALRVAHLQEGRDLLAEISLRLGVIKLDLQRHAEANDDFRLAHHLAPGRSVTDAEFKPEAVAAFQVALARPASMHARVLISAPKRRQWINGVEVFGDTLQLDEGLHLLVATSPGYHSRSKLLPISPGEGMPISMQLDLDPMAMRVLKGSAGVALGTVESEARLSADAMLQYSNTDTLVLVASAWRQGQPALLGQWCAGQPAQCSAVVEIGYPSGGLRVATSELWRTMHRSKLRFPPTLQVDARLVSGEGAPEKRKPKPHQPIWKNRWVWLGAAAIAVAGGAIYILAEPEDGTTQFVGDRCEFGGC